MTNLQKLKQEMLDAVDSICESYKKELEAKEVYEYPIYKISIQNKQIMKFDDLTSAITISLGDGVYKLGAKHSDFVRHTNTRIWLDLPYNKDTGFYDMQIVACRDKDLDFENIRLYNSRLLDMCDIIEPVEYPSEFMLEQQRLAIERFIDESRNN